MRYLMNGPVKEYMNKWRTGKMRTKLIGTTLVSPTRIHRNKKKHENKV